MIIGVTGRGGTGKTTISKKIQEINPEYTHIELDRVIEEKILKSSRLVNKINEMFDKKEYTIGDIVAAYFKNDEISKQVHNCFLEEVDLVLSEIINEKKLENVIVDWFLLHKIKSFNGFDIKILATLEEDERIKRVSKRKKTNDIDMFKLIDRFYDDNYSVEFDYIINTVDNSYEEMLDFNNKQVVR